MGNVCTNKEATAVGAPPAHPEEGSRPKKKRSVVGNMVHNVKKKMKPKPKWNDSKPEQVKDRKNHSQLDDYIEQKKVYHPAIPKPKPGPKPKSHFTSDGVPDSMDGFAPEAGVFGADFGHGGAGDGFGHGGDGGDGPDGGF